MTREADEPLILPASRPDAWLPVGGAVARGTNSKNQGEMGCTNNH